MTPSMITLIAWAPFLLLALIFGICFTVRGAKKGAARAAIALAATALSALASVFLAKLIAIPVGNSLTPVIYDMMGDGASELGAAAMAKMDSMIIGMAGAVASLVFFIPVIIIVSVILKVVASVITTKLMPEPKHIANKIGGAAIGFVDAILLALLILLPVYGTLSLVKDFKPVISTLEETDEVVEYLDAATSPFIVDVAGVPPFESAYDYLLSFKVEGSTVSLSAVARDASETYLEIMAIGDLKNLDGKDAIEVLDTIEMLIIENGFITDFACAFLSEELPPIDIPGVGKIKLNEYYPALNDPDRLREDLVAFIDLGKTMVESGFADALNDKAHDMSAVDAEAVSAAFGSTLNNSEALSTFKSKLIKDVVKSLSDDIINEGKDTTGAVQSLRDSILAIPDGPLSEADAKKEGEAIYLLITGALTASSNESNAGLGLGLMLEGLGRHPMIGVDKIVDAAGTIVTESGIPVNDKLVDNIKNKLNESVEKPLGESKFPEFCDTAFDTVDAIGGITEGKTDSESLKELVSADAEVLEMVKDSVSTELMEEIGMTKEQSEAMQTVVDSVFDAIIEVGCDEEKAEKEAEAIGSVLEIVTKASDAPEEAEKVFEEKAEELIDVVANSEIVEKALNTLTENGEQDPLDLFGELDEDVKNDISDKIDSYVGENGESAALEALKNFINLK